MESNQSPSSYHKDYFLRSCAGSREFELGVESTHEIFKNLFDIAGDIAGKTVLDVGCGRGEMALSAIRRGAKFSSGLDFSSDAIEIASMNLEHSKDIQPETVNFVCGDALAIDLGRKFDFIFIADVVEHMYDPQIEKLLSNMVNHLNDEGKIIIHTMPTREFIIVGQYIKFLLLALRGKLYRIITFKQQAAETHVNLQSKRTLSRLLRPYQFKVWNGFSTKSRIRYILTLLGVNRFMSSNLWAVVTK